MKTTSTSTIFTCNAASSISRTRSTSITSQMKKKPKSRSSLKTLMSTSRSDKIIRMAMSCLACQTKPLSAPTS